MHATKVRGAARCNAARSVKLAGDPVPRKVPQLSKPDAPDVSEQKENLKWLMNI